MATGIYQLARIPILRRCNGYYLRWYYNGWHYWYFLPGRVEFLTAGEDYRTLGTQRLTMGSGQITEEQCNAIRTIKNTREIYIWTDFGWWGCVRIEAGSVIVYDHALHGYEIELSVVVGSRTISQSGFSPAVVLPSVEPDPPCEVDIAVAGQIWMCANWDADFPGSKVYNDDEDNRVLFGGLYTWAQVMSAGFVPAGWHVPTYAEFLHLLTEVGGLLVAGGELKEIGTTHWDSPNTGAVDTYGYAAWGGGRYGFKLGVGTQFHDLYRTGFFWTQTGFVRMDHDSVVITDGEGIIIPGEYYSLRLIKDEYIYTPVALAATNVGNANFTANWETHSGVTNYYLDVSTDPAFGSFVGVYDNYDCGNVSHLDLSGLDPDTTYYYRIRVLWDGFQSADSNTITVTTPKALLVGTKGTGLGVAELAIETNGTTVVSLNGTARFYSDALGTLDESTTWQPSAGALRTRYVRCPSGTADLMFSDLNGLLKFGDPSGTNTAYVGWWYNPTLFSSANVPSLDTTNWNFPNCTHVAFFSNLDVTFNHAITDFSPNLVELVTFLGTITGAVTDIPATCEIFSVSTNTISGNVSQLPAGITAVRIGMGNTITGDIADLPFTALYHIDISGSNTIYGDIADIPATVTLFHVLGLNTIDGDIANFKSGMLYVNIGGYNTVTGDIADIVSTITSITIAGYNTIYGDLVDLPGTLVSVSIEGDNVIDGDIADLPAGTLTSLTLLGDTTVYGDIVNIPASVRYFYIGGTNTITGDLADLHSAMGTFNVSGNNTIYGLVEDLPASIISITLHGQNTVSGDFGGLPTACYYAYFTGLNTISDYMTKTWLQSGYTIILTPTGAGGLSSAEVDQFLIDIDNDCPFTITYRRTIDIRGTNAAPTATSVVARASLIAKGVLLNTN